MCSLRACGCDEPVRARVVRHDGLLTQNRFGVFFCERRDGVLPSSVLTEKGDTRVPAQRDTFLSLRARRGCGAFLAHTQDFPVGGSRGPAGLDPPDTATRLRARRALGGPGATPRTKVRTRECSRRRWASRGRARRALRWPRRPFEGPAGAGVCAGVGAAGGKVGVQGGVGWGTNSRSLQKGHVLAPPRCSLIASSPPRFLRLFSPHRCQRFACLEVAHKGVLGRRCGDSGPQGPARS